MSARIDGASAQQPVRVDVGLCPALEPAVAANELIMPDAISAAADALVKLANGDVAFASALGTIAGALLHKHFHDHMGAPKNHE